MAKCPLCDVRAATPSRLTKHLAGRRKNGGHEMPRMDAEEAALRAFAGGSPHAAAAPLTIPLPDQRPELLANPYASFLIRYFETLVAHKRLPKYQFERRVDAMIAMFLPAILRELRGWQVELVVPEFPLKKSGSNQSTNADHLLFRHAGEGIGAAWILFELKTDDASCRELQTGSYMQALKCGMPRLLADLDEIASATQARAKYAELRERVERFPAACPIELVYLSPCRLEIQDPCVLALTFADLRSLSLEEFPQVWELFRAIVLPDL